MRIFKDCNGVEWKLELNIYSAKTLDTWLKSIDTPVDMFDSSEFIQRIGSIIFAVDVLAVLTSEQRMERNVSDVDFGRALKGVYAYNAQNDLIDEYCDFFPDPAVQKVLKESLNRLKESSKREMKLVERAISAAVKAREKRIDEMEETMTSSDTSDT